MREITLKDIQDICDEINKNYNEKCNEIVDYYRNLNLEKQCLSININEREHL